jgi:hypothetical protein
MYALIVFESRHLVKQLTNFDDRRLVQAAVNCFLDVCLRNCHQPVGFDWDLLMREHQHESYLEVAIRGGIFNVVDSTTGQVLDVSWYARFNELMESLNKYYRSDVIATINYINESAVVRSIRYLAHDQQLLKTEVEYTLLLSGCGSS